MQSTLSFTSVYVVDDQCLVRASLKSSLGDLGFHVLGDCGEVREAVVEIGALQPDVVLLDISMPGLSGLDAIAKIRRAAPETKIIMVSNHEGGRFVRQALDAGADGYLSKASEPTELGQAIDVVHRGNSFISPKVGGGARSRPYCVAPRNGASRIDKLTPREREVFQLLALGRCNKEVACDLNVSLGTAKKHRENLQRKLDCHSAAELAVLAIREGLLDS